MRERYFRMYESIKYKECFYDAHFDRANRRYYAFTYMMLAISIGSVLIWNTVNKMPAIWSVVIAAAQFAQALSSYLLCSKQLTALKFLQPELKKLSLAVDRDWLALDLNGYSDKKILELVAKYESAYTSLENQFVQDTEFPESEAILKKAEKDTRAYFYSRYPSTSSNERGELVNV